MDKLIHKLEQRAARRVKKRGRKEERKAIKDHARALGIAVDCRHPVMLLREIRARGYEIPTLKHFHPDQDLGPHWLRQRLEQFPLRRVTEGEPDFLAFYQTWEWKRLSYDTRQQRGQRCECCGATPAHGVRIVCDHIKPIRHFWHLRLDPTNLQILCDDCNKGKGSRDQTDWRSSQSLDDDDKDCA